MFDVSANAEQVLIEALSEGNAEIDILLTNIVGKIICPIEDGLNANNKLVDKLHLKIKRFISRQCTVLFNDIEKVTTPLSVLIMDNLSDIEWLLQQILVKSGKLEPGKDLCGFTFIDKERVVQNGIIGTVKLDLGDLKVCCDSLIEVLREIRDRIPGTPVEYRGEEEAKEMPYEYIKAPGIAKDLPVDVTETWEPKYSEKLYFGDDEQVKE